MCAYMCVCLYVCVYVCVCVHICMSVCQCGASYVCYISLGEFAFISIQSFIVKYYDNKR